MGEEPVSGIFPLPLLPASLAEHRLYGLSYGARKEGELSIEYQPRISVTSCRLAYPLNSLQRVSQLNLRIQPKGKTEQVWPLALQGGVLPCLHP